MRRLISLFLAIIFWLSTPSVSLAQNNINNLDRLPLEKVQELISIRYSLEHEDKGMMENISIVLPSEFSH
ncbi:MAG: hypothetical protein QNJ68_11910 [Microcoleaceae cyanobacterium MO_207.B10]|nr:hypothetical protein [Microcoleaceae cyanobacterium MO_207.B10]